MLIIGVIFAIYLAVMVFVGIKFYNKSDGMSEYILGGRKLNSWVAAMSAQASDMSGWLLLGLPGTAYVVYAGTSEAIWVAIGLWLGTYLNWLFVAKRLRSYTHIAGNALTLPDFFENKFRDKSHILKTISAVFIVIFFLVYTSSQFSAGGKLFQTLFDIPYFWGMVIGASIILAYTALGGFTAVCWTDTIQGAIMFVALLIVPLVAVLNLDGWDGLQMRLAELTPEHLGFFPQSDGTIHTLLLASSVGWGLGYFGQPHILARFMAIQSPDMIQKSRIIAMVWVTCTLACAIVIGIIGKALIPDLPDAETVFMDLVTMMFHPVIAGILMISMLAAIMSTASSQLLVAACSVSKDLFATMAKGASEEKLVWVSRITVVAIALIAMMIALNPNSSVFGLVAFAWGGFGAAFGPIILFALFWRRMTRQGAIAGMLAGGIADLVWFFKSGGIFDIYEIIPGFVIGTVVIIIVSLCTKVDIDIIEEFDAVRNNRY